MQNLDRIALPYSRSILILVATVLLAPSCGTTPAGDGEGGGDETAARGAAAGEEQGQGEAISAEPAVFFSEELDDLDLPAAGEFRLELAGEIHEGPLSSCTWMSTDDGLDQDRLQATSERWTTDDGRAMQVEVLRFVNMNETFWTPSGGHEGAYVRVRLRDDGNESRLSSLRDTASSSANLHRAEPGAEPRTRSGAGEMPLVKISSDRRRATARGELAARDDYEGAVGEPLTGPFTLALHCPD